MSPDKTAVIEFAVQITCDSCVSKIQNSLNQLDGIKNVQIHKENDTVVVETALPSEIVKDAIETTGKRAVLKGYGGHSTISGGIEKGLQHGVAMLGGTTGYAVNGNIKGVVRFVQTDSDTCIIDGTIDGLRPGKHGVHIYECGDISVGCESIGEHFDLNSANHGGPENSSSRRHTGDLGNITADDTGRAMFRIEDEQIKVWDIIGRSIAVTDQEDDLGLGSNKNSLINGNSGLRLACGIISRSAGLFENVKKICACDGVTLWDERDKPLAGPGRQARL